MMQNHLEELLENYQSNFTNENHHSAIKSNLKNFETSQVIAFCEEQIKVKVFIETPHNSAYLFKLIDYAARTDTYFEEQRNRLLNYSLAIGGFSTTYVTSVLGAKQQGLISNKLFYTSFGFLIILVGCITAWIVYILSFSPRFPHRKKSYSPFFFIYNVCKKFSFLSLSFIPQTNEKKEEALKAFSLDLATYINRISDLTSDFSRSYKSGLTQVVMLFRTSQHKSKSCDAMRTILCIAFSIGFILYLVLLINALL